jgi:hypothetical protein
LDSEEKEMIILGDLNCNMQSSSRADSNTGKLKLLMELYQLLQVINQPTRITDFSETLIDVIISNEPERLETYGVYHLGISDHSLVYACPKVSSCQKQQPKMVTTRQFKNFDPDKFSKDLSALSWDTSTSSPRKSDIAGSHGLMLRLKSQAVRVD